MLRILQASDFHLDYSFPFKDELAEHRRQDQVKTFERVVNLAIKSEVDLLLIAGNLFASPRPDWAIVEKVLGHLQRLEERGIVPVVLPGSCDGVLTPDNVYRVVSFPGVLLTDLGQLRRPVSLETRRATVHLYGFVWGGSGDEGSLASLRRSEHPGFHVGVLQATLKEEEPESCFRELPAVDSETIRSWKLDYVALGNRRNGFTLNAEEGTLASFTGTPEGLDFTEFGRRHCALVTLEGGVAQVEQLPVNTCTLEVAQLEMGAESDQQGVAADIAERARPELLLRVELGGTGDSLIDVDRLHQEFSERFYYLEIEDRTDILHGPIAEGFTQAGGAIGTLVGHARELFDQAVSEADRRHVEDAFRTALSHLRAQEGGEP